MSAALVMALVAVALAIGAVVAAVALKSAYGKRITATMLAAAAIILGAYAWALHSWSVAT